MSRKHIHFACHAPAVGEVISGMRTTSEVQHATMSELAKLQNTLMSQGCAVETCHHQAVQ
eukprot:6464432-Amphidinium_carterae.1